MADDCQRTASSASDWISPDVCGFGIVNWGLHSGASSSWDGQQVVFPTSLSLCVVCGAANAVDSVRDALHADPLFSFTIDSGLGI